MSELVLHLGAHRTGTTSLQSFLVKNKRGLRSSGIDFRVPPQTRDNSLDQIGLGKGRILISDENILGTMEDCIWRGGLYPEVVRNLEKCEPWIHDVSTIYLSIRNLGDWWESAFAFCLKGGLSLPPSEQIQGIVDSDRGWNDVIEDIRQLLPTAKFVVREFHWMLDNPKQQLRRLTNWREFADTKLVRKKINSRAPVSEIAATLARRGEFESLSRLNMNPNLQLFNAKQKEVFASRYIEDLRAVSRRADITFWTDSDAKSGVELPPASPDKHLGASTGMPDEKTIVLHIGKTGGTYLKAGLDDPQRESNRIVFGKHGDTLVKSLGEYGLHRKIGFLFRDPAERFASGFLSRLRQGYPRYSVNWSTEEAIAFSFFESPNSLAEALGSTDFRLQSAAKFAFNSIFHLRFNYEHYLHSAEALMFEYNRGNIVFCAETSNVERYLEKIAGRLGVNVQKTSDEDRNSKVMGSKVELSALASKNLESYWKKEYQIFSACKLIASDLGFGD